MAFVRNYTGGTTNFAPGGKKILVDYQLAYVDGVSVSATFDAAPLTDDQTNELCYALHNAIAASGIVWVSNISVSVSESGGRSFTVALADPPPTTP